MDIYPLYDALHVHTVTHNSRSAQMNAHPLYRMNIGYDVRLVYRMPISSGHIVYSMSIQSRNERTV